MLVKIEARILTLPGTDFHFPSMSVPLGTFLGSGPQQQICSNWFAAVGPGWVRQTGGHPTVIHRACSATMRALQQILNQ